MQIECKIPHKFIFSAVKKKQFSINQPLAFFFSYKLLKIKYFLNLI